MNAANIITLSRIALVPFFMWSFSWEHPFGAAASFILFLAASATDGIDGYVARKFNQITTFGKFIDPLADKLLVTSAILMFISQGKMAVWAAMLIITRDFVVTSLRMVAVSKGKVIAARMSGKIKMVVQITGIALLLTPLGGNPLVCDITGIVLVIVTIWSGIDYVAGNKEIF